MSDTVLVDVADAVATITLNRPERLNALSPELLDALGDACERLAQDDDVRAVVVTGTGRGFCAGGDVKAMAAADGPAPGGYGGSERMKRSKSPSRTRRPIGTARAMSGTPHPEFEEGVERLRSWQARTSGALHTMPKPTIASINGFAMGAGLSIALACDLRVMSSSAQLGTAFAGVALSGDFGGSWFMTRLIGSGRTRELYLLGDRVPADRALALGLVNLVVVPDDLEAETRELAQRLARGPTRTLALMKQNLVLASSSGLDELLAQEALNQRLSAQTADHREAATAFVEKREPRFAGR